MKKIVLMMGLILHTMAFASASPAEVSYSVPVQEEELKPFANFVLKDFKMQEQMGGKKRITYTLPKELVGEKRKVAFTTSHIEGDTEVLTGPEGKLICTGNEQDKNLGCHAEYKMDLGIDPAKVDRVIRGMDIPESEKLFRLEIAARFSGEPIGLIYMNEYTGGEK